ncbi:MAG: hypothetical protein AAGK05_11355 [Pseudomonadota bacterium]
MPIKGSQKVMSMGTKGSRKAMSTARKSSHVKQVKKTMQNIVGEKLNSLGKVIKREASNKLHDLGRKAGEHAVQAVARRGKRILEDISETSLPPVKHRRLNAIPSVGSKKGYLSGTKQYGGARLF